MQRRELIKRLSGFIRSGMLVPWGGTELGGGGGGRDGEDDGNEAGGLSIAYM